MKSILKSHLPLVCFIAIKNNKDYDKVLELFRKEIKNNE